MSTISAKKAKKFDRNNETNDSLFLSDLADAIMNDPLSKTSLNKTFGHAIQNENKSEFKEVLIDATFVDININIDEQKSNNNIIEPEYINWENKLNVNIKDNESTFDGDKLNIKWELNVPSNDNKIVRLPVYIKTQIVMSPTDEQKMPTFLFFGIKRYRELVYNPKSNREEIKTTDQILHMTAVMYSDFGVIHFKQNHGTSFKGYGTKYQVNILVDPPSYSDVIFDKMVITASLSKEMVAIQDEQFFHVEITSGYYGAALESHSFTIQNEPTHKPIRLKTIPGDSIIVHNILNGNFGMIWSLELDGFSGNSNETKSRALIIMHPTSFKKLATCIFVRFENERVSNIFAIYHKDYTYHTLDGKNSDGESKNDEYDCYADELENILSASIANAILNQSIQPNQVANGDEYNVQIRSGFYGGELVESEPIQIIDVTILISEILCSIMCFVGCVCFANNDIVTLSRISLNLKYAFIYIHPHLCINIY